jgi:excisionase family DNA binding protein
MWSVTVLSYTAGTAKESPSVRVEGNRWQTEAMPARFLQMSDVAEELSVSMSQVYHMVRSGELPAIKVGGRGQWRVETAELEAYIQRMYAEARTFIDAHPFEDAEEVEGAADVVGPERP